MNHQSAILKGGAGPLRDLSGAPGYLNFRFRETISETRSVLWV